MLGEFLQVKATFAVQSITGIVKRIKNLWEIPRTQHQPISTIKSANFAMRQNSSGQAKIATTYLSISYE